HRVAALTPAQKSLISGGGSGDVACRCVKRIPVAPVARSERQVVPVPPSQPTPLGNGAARPAAGVAEAPPEVVPEEEAGRLSLRGGESIGGHERHRVRGEDAPAARRATAEDH